MTGRTMDPATWTRIKQVVADVAHLSGADRAEAVRRACGGDPRLVDEVSSLLASLDSPPAVLGALGPSSEEPAAPEEHTGTLVGPYRIEAVVGHGGMGAVYRAVRADGQFEKEVAVKFVRRGPWSSLLQERFQRERRTLALLNHPNIAGIIDGGTTANGTPYFVMEYVDGVPIDDYCDRHRLAVRDRLRIFLGVCDAVQYAHRNLIVHRDLKPGNILVTPDGTPKLLDFGIAELLGTAEQESSRPAERSFTTPEYASPEQLRGEPITTSSDVYSLGVLLYLLLVGSRPYSLRDVAAQDIPRFVASHQATAPSLRVKRRGAGGDAEQVAVRRSARPETLSRQLAGDLDAIMAKALQKDSRFRYMSAEQLAEDLQRHLAGLPVHARRGGTAYRTARFVRRHALGVGATALVLVTLMAGILGTLWQARQARREAEKAAQISAFLERMLGSASPAEMGKDVTVAEVLGRAADNAERDLAAQHDVRAAVLRTIGESYVSLGLYARGVAVLEGALRAAEASYGPRHEETGRAVHSLAYATYKSSAYARADSLFGVAVAILRGSSNKPTQALAAVLTDYGMLMRDRGKTAEGAQLFREAVAVHQLAGGPERERATLLSNLGPALMDLHELAAAESVFQQALEIQTRELGEEHIEVSYTLNNLAFLHMEQGDFAGAAGMLRRSLEIRRTTLPAGHPEIPVAMMNLGGALLKEGKLDEAEELTRTAAAALDSIPGVDPLRLSSASYIYALVLMARGRHDEAVPRLRAALAAREEVFPPDNPAVVKVRKDLDAALAATRHAGGHPAEATAPPADSPRR